MSILSTNLTDKFGYKVNDINNLGRNNGKQ